MTEYRSVLERAGSNAPPPDLELERILRRRDRKRRNQRILAGSVGIAVFVTAVWVVTSVGSLDRTQTPVVPGGDTTGPPVTGSAPPVSAIGPVPETDYLLDLDTGEMTPLPESIVGDGQGIFGATDYAASPDGSRLAYSARGDNGESQIFVANLDGTAIEQVTHDLATALSPVWSPDGSRIAFTGYRGDDAFNLFVLDLATGSSTQLTFEAWEPGPGSRRYGWMASTPSFTPDGSSIVYNAGRFDSRGFGSEHEVRIVPVAGGESVRFGSLSGRLDGPNAIRNARLSPDGSLLSYACDGYSALCVANADGTGGRVVAYAVGGGAINGGSWSPDGTRIPHFTFYPQDVMILDVATGRSTYVGEGMEPTWLDDHTLIIQIARCYDPEIGGWNTELGCPG